MTAFNPLLSPQPSNNCSNFPSRGNLRPDLAAYFVQASREPAPRQIGKELGVLAELRAQSGHI